MRQVISQLVTVSYESRWETPAAGVQSRANVTPCNRGREGHPNLQKIHFTLSHRPGTHSTVMMRAGVTVAAFRPVYCRLFLFLFFSSPSRCVNSFWSLIISWLACQIKNSLVVQDQIWVQPSSNLSSHTSSNVKTGRNSYQDVWSLWNPHWKVLFCLVLERNHTMY